MIQTTDRASKNPVLLVTDASQNSPAYLAGIVPGTVIVKLTSGSATADIKTATSTMSHSSKSHQNDPFSITYIKPDGVQESTVVAAVYGIVPDRKSAWHIIDTVGYVPNKSD
jgi:S1-C subfamily serine protease